MDFDGEKIYKCGDSLSKIYKCGEVVWSADTKPDYSKEYFTIEALENGTLTAARSLNMRKNKGEWINTNTIELSAGDKVEMRDMDRPEGTSYLFSGQTLSFNVYGNIQSLFFGDNFYGQTSCKISPHMFMDSNVVSAANLILPATELLDSCYLGMFENCTNFIASPTLPATQLADHCYRSMFQGCTSLNTVPELPATTLNRNCYTDMFRGCTSLETAPVLPDARLDSYCYQYMFSGCTNLNYVKALLANPQKQYAQIYYASWLIGVSPTGTFVKKADADWPSGDSGIPNGWTVIEE